jgi:transketolase
MNLEQMASKVRLDILNMIAAAGSGHIGGSFSAVELMVALYFSRLRHDPQNPWWDDRDRVIFSKGHASALLYACLAESGYFPVKMLPTFRRLGSKLQGHPARNGLPGVEVSTGSLGQGLSVGVGMALALKLLKKPSRVYVLIGDGECQCGQIWEAAMSAAHYRLDNLCVILDHNGLQIDGTNDEVMDLGTFGWKWDSFGWNVIPIEGHDLDAIRTAYDKAATVHNTPTVIIAFTTKGKGVSFMEGQTAWHGKVPKGDWLKKATEELNV